jgi:hypothetical protein
MELVTFRAFSSLAKQKGFSETDLIDACRPWWEGHDPVGSFAKRVFTPMHGDVVIPYRPLLKLYSEWQQRKQEQRAKVCACGCGTPIKSTFKRYVNATHRQRHHRLVSDGENK